MCAREIEFKISFPLAPSTLRKAHPLSLVYALMTFEHIVNEFIKQEDIKEVTIWNLLRTLLLSADDIVHFANTLEEAQKLNKTFTHNRHCVISSKTKV
mgnify:FL=1